ncbi:MAG: HAD-IB family phosphatase [Gemmatimonadaceae bacterium]|nr:HAD-IB family phosphatase [Gemmatimonadaceae bacterium]NUQ92179.1 HAD-IB family phosphatase [Gemmatimonadaceae bacterium]NUR20960.1 HAD-IB family phosphatase [Gemmatimonadaceae bacterium]NUS97471.1 HAD-IB family phosphatase [Gemmatimonadaceae bacterium]
MSTARAKFASVVLDVDSTLAGVEGIDWLAAQRGPEAAAKIAELTDMAMRGEISLDEIYGKRLSMIRPTHREIGALAKRYVEAMAPGAREVVARLREAGVAIAIVSGGIREAIVPLALALGVDGGALRAVSVYFEAHGEYEGFERSSPLATQRGKAEVVRALALGAPVLAVGDGATDVAMRPVVDAFAAYTGFVRREPVVQQADFVLESFAQLEQVVLA